MKNDNMIYRVIILILLLPLALLLTIDMSRSKLRDKFMRKCYTGKSYKGSHENDPVRNPHRQDEMPKNMPSRLIFLHGPGVKVDWLQDSTSFGGHSRPKGGYRMVSGLVRASLKRESQKQILEQLADYNEDNQTSFL